MTGEDEQLESLVTLVAAPVSPWFASIPTLTASRVAGLQDFFTHYKPDASPNKTCGSQASVTSTSLSSTSDDLAKDLVPRLIAKPSGRRYKVELLNMVTNGLKKNLAVLTRVFLTRKCEAVFARQPKKVAIITR